jgi:hypothetical protein
VRQRGNPQLPPKYKSDCLRRLRAATAARNAQADCRVVLRTPRNDGIRVKHVASGNEDL